MNNSVCTLYDLLLISTCSVEKLPAIEYQKSWKEKKRHFTFRQFENLANLKVPERKEKLQIFVKILYIIQQKYVSI